eukprot:3841857-Rhodomonas_salina.2
MCGLRCACRRGCGCEWCLDPCGVTEQESGGLGCARCGCDWRLDCSGGAIAGLHGREHRSW